VRFVKEKKVEIVSRLARRHFSLSLAYTNIEAE
jgi:hypothetical protein